MADITFTGNKKLKSINREWCTKFPYLYLGFFDADGKGQGDWSVNHSTVRAKKDASELATTGNMNVGTFETRYKNAFGSPIEIKYVKNGRNYRSLDEHNNLTLAALNRWAAENGASNVLETHPEWF
ncbi:MAG: hypothetical protein ACK45H_14055 [Bacteroidota bacterium]|jgi:hypothetical protein